jgi:hypothetical protein
MDEPKYKEGDAVCVVDDLQYDLYHVIEVEHADLHDDVDHFYELASLKTGRTILLAEEYLCLPDEWVPGSARFEIGQEVYCTDYDEPFPMQIIGIEDSRLGHDQILYTCIWDDSDKENAWNPFLEDQLALWCDRPKEEQIRWRLPSAASFAAHACKIHKTGPEAVGWAASIILMIGEDRSIPSTDQWDLLREVIGEVYTRFEHQEQE